MGIASGDAFCNRQEETRLLQDNMMHGKHTLLMATRRYGKSSLALQALALSGYPYSEIDFFMATNEKVIESYILSGVLHYLATQSTTHLTSKAAIFQLKMTSSSIVSVLETLEEKDVIEKNEREYQIISPVIQFYARQGGVS